MEKKAPRTFSFEFKEEAVKRILRGERPASLSRELGVSRSKLYKWRDQYRQGGERLWRRADGRPAIGSRDLTAPLAVRLAETAPESQLAELERKVGKQQLVIDFLQQALRRVEGGRAKTKSSGETGSIPTSER